MSPVPETVFEDRLEVRAHRLMGNRLAHLNPVRTIEDNLIVNVDGSYGVAMRLQCPNLFTYASDRKAELLMRLRTSLNILPEDYDVQIIFGDNGDCDDFIANINGGAELDGLVKTYAEEQQQQLRQEFQEGTNRWLMSYVCLVRKNPFSAAHFRARTAQKQAELGGKKANPIKTVFKTILANYGMGELSVEYTENEWDELKAAFGAEADKFYSELANAGLLPVVLSANQSLDLLHFYWNPAGVDRGAHARAFNPAENIPLTSHFLPTSGIDIETTRKDGIMSLDGMKVIVATMDTMPEKLQFSQFAKVMLAGGSRGQRFVLTLRHADMAKRIKTVSERLPELEGMAKKNPFYLHQYEDAVRELAELGKGTEKVWEAQYVFIVAGADDAQVRHRFGTLESYAEKSGGMKIIKETHAALDYFIAAQPFWTRDGDTDRYVPVSTTQAATQWPCFGQPGFFDDANGKPGRIGSIYTTTTGGLVNLYLHDDTRFSNFNTFVIGGSGKGKGVFLNDMISQYRCRRKARWIIIDADMRAKGGGSYKRTASCNGGDYIDFDLQTKGRVSNPFYTEGNHFPDPDELDAMVSGLERYLVTPTQPRLEPSELGAIENVIKQIFRAADGKREVTMSDFRRLLNENESTKHLVGRLIRWVGDGSYANLSDGPNGLTINKWLTVFNLTRIKTTPALCPIVFGNIFATILQLASRYPNEDKFVVFDECADFLKDPVVAAYIEKCYRQMRKAGVAVIGMSQSLEEFMATASATGFITNTDHLFLLQQGATEVADMIRDAFRLSEAEYQTLLALKSDPGNYSQIMIRHKLGDGRYVSDVVVKRPTPLGYAMATTNASDHAAFEALREAGYDFEGAVREFARRYPCGVSRAGGVKTLGNNGGKAA